MQSRVDGHRGVGDDCRRPRRQVPHPLRRRVEAALAQLESPGQRFAPSRQQYAGDHDHLSIGAHRRQTVTVTVK